MLSIKCPKCGKTILYNAYSQTPGCRMIETLDCPNCGEELLRTLEWEFFDIKVKNV